MSAVLAAPRLLRATAYAIRHPRYVSGRELPAFGSCSLTAAAAGSLAAAALFDLAGSLAAAALGRPAPTSLPGILATFLDGK